MARLLHIGITLWAASALAVAVFPADEPCACTAEVVGHEPADCACEHGDDEDVPCECCDRAESEQSDGRERANLLSAPVRPVLAHATTTMPLQSPAVIPVSTAAVATASASRAPPVYLLISSFLT